MRNHKKELEIIANDLLNQQADYEENKGMDIKPNYSNRDFITLKENKEIIESLKNSDITSDTFKQGVEELETVMDEINILGISSNVKIELISCKTTQSRYKNSKKKIHIASMA